MSSDVGHVALFLLEAHKKLCPSVLFANVISVNAWITNHYKADCPYSLSGRIGSTLLNDWLLTLIAL